MKRRHFLLSALSLAACRGGADVPPAEEFPQGIASGDPTNNSVVLWSRIEPAVPGLSEEVLYEVAHDEDFLDIVRFGTLQALAENDHTVRVRITDLAPYTTYYYRFTVREVASQVGRTKTAPSPDDDVQVRFAFASCQDYVGRYYHAWRAMLDHDIDFVVFLGDFIYETVGDTRFQNPNADRSIGLPHGKQLGEDQGNSRAASSLEDYREIYKRVRTDPDLREVQRLFPFVTIWDDHEFANDCWQDHSTDFAEAEGDEQSTDRRRAATKAWFEHQPVDVTFDADADYPHDVKIYRQLRFGKALEIFMTDQRYYRDDHVIAEGPQDIEVGKVFENSTFGSRNFVIKSAFDEREAQMRPTMLGAEQRDWLVQGMQQSEATWKVWGSSTQVAQMVINMESVTSLPDEFRDLIYQSVDQWDGYRSERGEILTALADVDNVAVISGDIHAFYASELHADFDAPSAAIGVEFVTAGISSASAGEIAKTVIEGNATLKAIGLGDAVGDMDIGLMATDAHRRHANSFTNGFALAEVTSQRLSVRFISIANVVEPTYSGAEHEAEFHVAVGSNVLELV